MPTVYDYIKSNRGLFATHLDVKFILEHFKFSDETASLKKAIEKSIDECIATYVVDSLLECNISTILQFIDTLQKKQPCFTKYFYETWDQSDQCLYDYTHAQSCATPIPFESKKNIQFNYTKICELYLRHPRLIGNLIDTLVATNAISQHDWSKLYTSYADKNYILAIKKVLNFILNGNKYQYIMFKKAHNVGVTRFI